MRCSAFLRLVSSESSSSDSSSSATLDRLGLKSSSCESSESSSSFFLRPPSGFLAGVTSCFAFSCDTRRVTISKKHTRL